MLKVCTAEYMISDSGGLRMRPSFYPRIVGESYAKSTKDGEVSRAPDAVTMIDTDVTYMNNTPDDQQVAVSVHRGPRAIVTTDPNTILIHDAWSFAVGESPAADFPTIYQDTFGGKLQRNKPEATADKLTYGRYFLSCNDSQTWVSIGIMPPNQALHFRYIASVQTPGVWIVPTEVDSRYEAYARWVRLRVIASPVGSR